MRFIVLLSVNWSFEQLNIIWLYNIQINWSYISIYEKATFPLQYWSKAMLDTVIMFIYWFTSQGPIIRKSLNALYRDLIPQCSLSFILGVFCASLIPKELLLWKFTSRSRVIMIKGIDGHSDNDQLIHIWASPSPLSDPHWVGRDGFLIILDRLEFFLLSSLSVQVGRKVLWMLTLYESIRISIGRQSWQVPFISPTILSAVWSPLPAVGRVGRGGLY